MEVSEEMCAERRKTLDERFDRDKERLNDLEECTKKLTETSIQMSEMLKKHDEVIDKQDERLTAIEQRPASKWDKVESAIITAVVSGLVAAAISIVLN